MKFAFILILAFIPFLGLAQEGNEGTPPEIQDEAALEELQKNRELRQKKLDEINSIVGPVKKDEAQESFTPLDLMNNESLDRIEKTLKDANMSQYPPELLREKIVEAFKGNPLEGFVKASPRLQNFFVDVVKDDKALLGGIAIFKDKARLKIYLYIWIGVMFAAYYTKRLFISKYWKRGTRVFAGMLFSLTITTITMSSFCLVFENEMKPIIALIKKHLI